MLDTKTDAACMDTEIGWYTTTIKYSASRGQDRATRSSGLAQSNLRSRLRGGFVRVQAKPKSTRCTGCADLRYEQAQSELGVAVIIAVTIIAGIGDLSRFDNAKQLMD